MPPFGPVGSPASGERSIPVSQKKKETTMPSKSSAIAAPTKNASSTTKPVRTFRLGRVKAAIWENEADAKKFYNVTFARTYMDDARNFHDTDSFGRDDLPLIAKVADQAHTFIFERLAGQKTEPTTE